MRTVIAGGGVLTPRGLERLHVAVEGGHVAELLDPAAPLRADRTIDASGLLVLPGAIDPHVHFDVPGDDVATDFAHGTRCAAAGGVTFVVEHPFTDPLVTTAERYADKAVAAARGAVVDFGLWGGLAAGSIGEIAGQAALGAGGFKAYMASNDMDWPPADEATLREGFAAVAAVGGLALVHAEDRATVDAATAEIRASGRTDALAAADARPAVAETIAVRLVLELAAETGARVHLLHLSTPEAVSLVLAARARGLDVSYELTAHHLLLDRDDLARVGALATCAPPLRDRSARERLWEVVLAGEGDMVVTDHCPYDVADKLAGERSPLDRPHGVQSLQEYLPLLFDAAVGRRGMGVPELVALTAAGPARRLGLYPRKGAIALGSDADLVLLDPGAEWVLDPARQLSESQWSPYAGRELRGAVVTTIARGETVFADGEVRAAPGRGRFTPLARGAAA
ncbi:dihydroorotase [Conexibacter woesei]|uniref:Amidohydrolase n=1 Tax=Conexibacter woesei (strain DSM 14684 / CCUG 47730 / CIP 108061 / JCM 11494 / NBRC 100937 / ID131577) TaxID=469383 RepID=D3F1S3_CONWI|nr:amidohydrolase family protein [Conexibacter woesei]ADB54104.1 amidohydrolase [Conexibacter woesei DSM 14684]